MLGAVRHVEVAQEHVTCQEDIHEEADKYRGRRGGGQMVFQAEQTACTEDVRWAEHEAVERLEAGLCAWIAAGERVGLRDVGRDQITQGSDYMDFIPS